MALIGSPASFVHIQSGKSSQCSECLKTIPAQTIASFPIGLVAWSSECFRMRAGRSLTTVSGRSAPMTGRRKASG